MLSRCNPQWLVRKRLSTKLLRGGISYSTCSSATNSLLRKYIAPRSSIITYHPTSSIVAVTIMCQPSRHHSGHGHHHHHHDNTYLVSTNKNDPGVRITRIGLAVNLVMAVTKGLGGYVFHSQCKLPPPGHDQLVLYMIY